MKRSPIKLPAHITLEVNELVHKLWQKYGGLGQDESILSKPALMPSKSGNYPKIMVERSLSNPGFSKIVDSIVPSIDFRNRSQFPAPIQFFLQRMTSVGAETAFLEMDGKSYELYGETHWAIRLIPSFIIGKALMEQIRSLSGDRLFPFNDIEVSFKDKEIILGLSSLKSKTVGKRTLYYSRNHFKIEFEGESKILAFYGHAIENLCLRFKPDFQTYGGLGDAHGLFSRMSYVDQVMLANNYPAIGILDMCLEPGTWEYEHYVRKLITEIDEDCKYSYRVGYCPIVRLDEFAVARTFLPPGYFATPEGIAIRNCKSLPHIEKKRLQLLAKNMNRVSLQQGKAFDAVEWFHRNGVPQVKIAPQPIFDDEYLKKKLRIVG